MPEDKIKLIRKILTETRINCANIVHGNNHTVDEYNTIFKYYKTLAKDFSLITTLTFDTRFENSKMCTLTLNLLFGWHQGIKEELIKVRRAKFDFFSFKNSSFG